MKSVRIFSLFTFIFCIDCFSVTGTNIEKFAERIFAPDYISLQYAGNLGLGSIGSRYISKNNHHNFGFSYGYLPESVNGTEVHTVSIKDAFNLNKKRLTKAIFFNGYFGTNLLYAITDNTYLDFPGQYPSNYYFTNAVHFAPFIGLKVGAAKFQESLSKYIYIELGSIDYYLFHNLKNKHLKLQDCMNICIGIALPINDI